MALGKLVTNWLAVSDVILITLKKFIFHGIVTLASWWRITVVCAPWPLPKSTVVLLNKHPNILSVTSKTIGATIELFVRFQYESPEVVNLRKHLN